MNRISLPLLALTGLAATPAQASVGYVCETSAPGRARVVVTLGAGPVGGIVSATLYAGERSWATAGPATNARIGQHWVDQRSLLLDIVDLEGTARIARVRVGQSRPLESRALYGTIEHEGIVLGAVCRVDG